MKTLKSVLLAASLIAAGGTWAGAIIHDRAIDEKGRAVELHIADGRVTGPKGEKIADGKYTLSNGQKIDVTQGKALIDLNYRPGAAINPNFKPGGAIAPDVKPGDAHGVIVPDVKPTGK